MAAKQSQAQIWKVSSINAGPGAVLANTAVLRVESKTNETQFHTIHLIQQSPRWKPQTVHLPVSSLSAGPLHLAALPAPPPDKSLGSPLPWPSHPASSLALHLSTPEAASRCRVWRKGGGCPCCTLSESCWPCPICPTGLHFVTQLFLEQFYCQEKSVLGLQRVWLVNSCL